MFVLLIILVSASGFIQTQTLTFKTEKQCLYAAQQVESKPMQQVKVTAFCLKQGLIP